MAIKGVPRIFPGVGALYTVYMFTSFNFYLFSLYYFFDFLRYARAYLCQGLTKKSGLVAMATHLSMLMMNNGTFEYFMYTYGLCLEMHGYSPCGFL